MNRLLEFLNVAGDWWADLAWAGLCQSSILILLVWLADRLLRRRVRPVVRHALWVLVPIKLLLPASFALPTGVGYWIPRPWQVESQSRMTEWMAEHGSPLGIGEMAPPGETLQSSRTVPRRPDIRWTAVALIAWAAGAMVLLGLVGRRLIASRASRLRNGGAADSLESCVAEVARTLGLRRSVEVRRVIAAQSPALFGLWRQTVLVPEDLERTLSPAQMRGVIMHELVHARRGDVWVNALQVLAHTVWWWHPLAWFAGARLRAACEEAVDDEVAFRLGRDAEAYPEALLAVAGAAVGRPGLSVGLLGIVETRSALRIRIERLLDNPPSALPRLGVRACLGLGVLALTVMPMACGRAASEVDSGVSAQPVGLITAVETRYKDLVVPEDESAEGMPAAEDQGSGDRLVTRIWKLDFEVVIPALETKVGRSLGEDAHAWVAALREVLEAGGLSLHPPNAIFLKLRTPLLMVRAPSEQVESVQQVVDQLSWKPPQVVVEAAFLEVAPELLENQFPDAVMRGAGSMATSVAPRPITREALQALLSRAREGNGVRSVGRPRVTTLSGRTAEVSLTDGPTNRTRTLSIRVHPEVAPNGRSIRLDTVARWTRAYVSKAMQDLVTGENGADLSREVYSVNAIGYVSGSLTNSVVVDDGGAYLLGSPVPAEGGQQMLGVVVVSSMVIDAAGNPVNPVGR